jgi:hypothetical protein
VGAWNFNETSGSQVQDRSGKANNGTISGATRVTGKYGRALRFDGVNDMVTVPDSASLDLSSAMTIEAWVNPSALGKAWRTVVLKEQSRQLVYGLYACDKTGFPSGHVFSNQQWAVQGRGALPLNSWRHLAVTWDGATLRIYVNGAFVAQRATSTTRIVNSAGALRFGGNTSWANEWFKGAIDDIRIYNRNLSAAELSKDMNTPVS